MCTEAPLIKALMKISDKIQLARANPTAASRICQAPANKDKLETILTALMVALYIDTYLRTIDPVSMHTRAFVPKKDRIERFLPCRMCNCNLPFDACGDEPNSG